MGIIDFPEESLLFLISLKLGDGGSGENVDGSEDGGSDKSSEDNDHGERKLYNGSTDGQDEEEYEDQVEEDDDDDSASSSSDTATTSSSSRRRLVIKNVKYFAKHNLERYLKRRGFVSILFYWIVLELLWNCWTDVRK